MAHPISSTYAPYVPSSRISSRIKKEFFYGAALFFIFCAAFSFTLSHRKIQIVCAGFCLFLTHYFFCKAQKICDYTNELELQHLREEAEKTPLEASLQRHKNHFFVVVSQEKYRELFWREGFFSLEKDVEKLFFYYERQKKLFQRCNLQESFVKVVKIQEEKQKEVREALGVFMQSLDFNKIGKTFFAKDIPKKAFELGIITELENRPFEEEDSLGESFCLVEVDSFRKTEESSKRGEAFQKLMHSLIPQS